MKYILYNFLPTIWLRINSKEEEQVIQMTDDKIIKIILAEVYKSA